MGRWRKESNTKGIAARHRAGRRRQKVAATPKVKRQQNDASEKQSTDKKAMKEAVEANETASKKKPETIILSSSESDEEEAEAEVLISSKKSSVVAAKNGAAAVTKKKLESSGSSSSSDEDNVSTNPASCMLASAHHNLQKTVASQGKMLLRLQKAIASSQGKKLQVSSTENGPSGKKHESRDVSSESESESEDEGGRDIEDECLDHSSDKSYREPQKKKLKVQVPSPKDVPSVGSEKKDESIDVTTESEDEVEPEEDDGEDGSSDYCSDESYRERKRKKLKVLPNINTVKDMSSAEDEVDSSTECSDSEPWKKQSGKPAVAAKTDNNSDEKYSPENEDDEHAKSPKRKPKTRAILSDRKGKRKIWCRSYNDGSIYFRSDMDRKKYQESFIHREVLQGRTVNFDFFDQENLMIGEWMSGLGWKKFLVEKNVVYPDLVRQFYAHLDENMVSYVKGVEINLTQEILGEILGMDASNDDKEYQNATKEIVFKDLSGCEVFGISLQIKDMSLPVRLLHMIVVNSILPRMGSKEVINVDNASVMWCAIKGYKVNLPRAILNHMRATLFRKDLALPYGMLMTRILEYFKVDLEGEQMKSPDHYDVIDEITAKKMGFKKDEVRGWVLKNKPPLESPQAGQEMVGEGAIQGKEEIEGSGAEEDAVHSPHLDLSQSTIYPNQESPQQNQTEIAPSISQPNQPPTVEPTTQTTFPSTFSSDLVQLIRDSLDERIASFESKVMSKIEALDGRVAVIEHGISTTYPTIQEKLKQFEAHEDFFTKEMLAVRTSLTETTKDIKDGLHHLGEKLTQLRETNAFRAQPYVPVCLTPPHLRKQS